MARSLSIAVLLDPRDAHAERRQYRIWPLIEAWKRLGHGIVVTRDPDEACRADVLLPHLDVSRIPEPIWKRIRTHARLLNRHIRDVRKSAISAHLLNREDPHTGPVIVKTNNNSGGFRDFERTVPRWLRTASLAWHRVLWSPAARRHGFRWTRMLPRYPVFPSIESVPTSVWANPHLVVERFFEPDRDAEGRYVMFMWIVLGDRGLGRTLSGRTRVVKDTNAKLGAFERPPEMILATQRSLGVEYGKIDYVVHQGQPVVLDINPTPVVTGESRTDKHILESGRIASAIESLPWSEPLSVETQAPDTQTR
ncbi:MAG: hypothetical protein AAGB48_00815 [Planctomycetota bacterium]